VDAVAGATPLKGGASHDAGDPAMNYVWALQQGDAATVVAMTQWMQDRLERVRLEKGEHAVETEHEALCKKALERRAEDQHVGPRGAKDQYVFLPDASVEVVGYDEGSDDLEQPVAKRTWLLVTYRDPLHAPMDEAGTPVRALVAGLSVSEAGMVLKAGVAGNVEIDRASIVRDWPAGEGGHE
jgi:hypothetical protein